MDDQMAPQRPDLGAQPACDVEQPEAGQAQDGTRAAEAEALAQAREAARRKARGELTPEEFKASAKRFLMVWVVVFVLAIVAGIAFTLYQMAQVNSVMSGVLSSTLG